MKKLLFLLLFIPSVCLAQDAEMERMQIDSVNLGGKHIKPKEITTNKLTVNCTKVQVFKTGTYQTITGGGANYNVTLDSASFDTLREWSIVDSSLTVINSGYYDICLNYNIRIQAGSNLLDTRIWRNNTLMTNDVSSSTYTSPWNYYSNSIRMVKYLNAGDKIKFSMSSTQTAYLESTLPYTRAEIYWKP
jgi:hypothetical protein